VPADRAANPILSKWNTLGKSAAGRWLFSRGLGVMVPYSGTIRPLVKRLEAGHGLVQMRDRRRVRNHLRSVHAAAMLNLTELTGGLLATVSMPAEARMIITRVTLDFIKKGRGLLEAEGTCPVPETNERAEIEVQVVIRDTARDVVAQGTVRVLIGPVPKAP
jgi:acyl-coenzyme A thioesterase PaaI-like protein